MIIREKAYPRAALIGNPSDGYFGKTIAFVFRNYSAEVTLYESPNLEILPSVLDYNTYENMADLAADNSCRIVMEMLKSSQAIEKND